MRLPPGRSLVFHMSRAADGTEGEEEEKREPEAKDEGAEMRGSSSRRRTGCTQDCL